ncbi:MAG: hypothetical protein ACFE9I_18175 [Candidatus Hermodarchaeota archaeon]
MSVNNEQEKKCAECNSLITFEEFCRINPSMSLDRAQEFWNDSLFSIFCPGCYFNLVERPFKVKRSYFNYYFRFRK